MVVVCFVFLNKGLGGQSLHFVYLFVSRVGWGVLVCTNGISTLGCGALDAFRVFCFKVADFVTRYLVPDCWLVRACVCVRACA